MSGVQDGHSNEGRLVFALECRAYFSHLAVREFRTLSDVRRRPKMRFGRAPIPVAKPAMSPAAGMLANADWGTPKFLASTCLGM